MFFDRPVICRPARGCPTKGWSLIALVGDPTALMHRSCDGLSLSAKCPPSGSRTWRVNDAGGSGGTTRRKDGFAMDPFEQ